MKKTDKHPESISDIFEKYVVDDLKKICSYITKMLEKSGKTKIVEKPNRKAELIQWNSDCLKEIKFLKFIYKNMNELEKNALKEAVHGNAKLENERFRAKYGELPNLVVSSYWSSFRKDKKKYEFPPLALFMNSQGQIPPDMQKRLKSFVPKPEETKASSLNELPESIKIEITKGVYEDTPLVQHVTEQTAINDLMAVLQIVDMGRVSVSAKTGRPSVSGAENIRKVLSRGDFYPEDMEDSDYDIQIGRAGIRPFAWAMLLQASGLVKINGTKLELSRTGKAALKKPAHETLKVIWNRWLKYKNFHEMSRIEVIKGQKSKSRPLYVAASSRPKIAEGLFELEEGNWIKTSDFFDFMIAKGHGFNVVRDAWPLYLEDPNYGSFGYSHITWNHINKRFASAFLLEYAAVLGVIDAALIPPWGAVSDHRELWGADDISCLSRYDGLYALRLNSLGAWILGHTDEYTPVFHDEASLHVFSDLKIESFAPEESPDELFLERFCKKISGNVWEINMEKIFQALEEGTDLSNILSFIETKNDGPVPYTVQEFFNEVSDRASKVKDAGEARLIKCEDKTIAQLIAGSAKLKKLCFLAGEKHLAVPKDNESQFRRELRKLGYVLGSYQ